jgi:hypothetical protein
MGLGRRIGFTRRREGAKKEEGAEGPIGSHAVAEAIAGGGDLLSPFASSRLRVK